MLETTEQPLREQTLERLRRDLGSRALEAQLAAGAALSPEEAIGVARRLAAVVKAGGSADV